MKPLTTDLTAGQMMQLALVKKRSGNQLHCRLGGTPTGFGGGYLQPDEEARRTIAAFLGRSAPQPPLARVHVRLGLHLVSSATFLTSLSFFSPLSEDDSLGLSPSATGLREPRAVVGRVEPGALEMDRDRVQDSLDGALAADLADLRRVVGHLLEDLEEMAVRAFVLVDRH